MKILTTEQIRQADNYTIQHEPINSVDLMERAASAFVDWFIANVSRQKPVKVFCGPGNNGGDGWAVARLLAEEGYSAVNLYLLKISDKLSPDSEINRQRLINQAKVQITEIVAESEFPEIHPDEVIIDGLFGSGLSRPLEGLAVSLVHFLNESKRSQLIAIDIPSGLFGEDNRNNDSGHIVKADVTLTFQFPKLSFLFPENSAFVGKWEVIPIGLHKDFIRDVVTRFHYLTGNEVSAMIQPRAKFSHKGTYGNGLLISGSYGMMGAAILASGAAIRSGIGLVTAHVPRYGYAILQGAVPEALISIDSSDIIFSEYPPLDKYNAVAVGPGLGQKENSQRALKKLLTEVKVPLVIDADGLNIISQNQDWIDLIPENSIITPHPKEFERLFGKYDDHFSRNNAQMELSVKHKLYIVLKGAHTAISCPDGACYFNTTGNPGMATGGSGDVLTGIILSLLSQGYPQKEAALTGVYIHGLAGDIAASQTGQQALIASDIINSIGKAFINLENL